MNAERLLAHYERIADAPDAIARLRRFILDLAVRGKLVPQDPKDEPASRPKGRAEDGLQFDLPAGWHAVTIADVLLELQTGPFGSSLHQSDYVIGGTPVVNPASIQNGHIVPIAKMAVGATTVSRLSTFKLQVDDVVMARRGEMGRCAVVSEKEQGWLCGTGSLILRPSSVVDSEFLALLIGTPSVRSYLGETAVGTTMQNLNQGILLKLSFGLPPLVEQRRIVAKVDELMALCDRLATARAEREIKRDRLTVASLARLNEPDPETFTDDAQFALNVLPALTRRLDQIKQVRQTILNLAVRGKLVPQDPRDEPAAKLLRRTGKLPLPSRYAKRSLELIPGDCGLSINMPNLPLSTGWLWVPLVEIARIESGHTPSRSRPDWWEGDVPWMGLVDARIHNNGRIFDTIQHTNKDGLANSAACLLPEGTVCFSRTASVGYVVIMGRPMATSQDFVNWVPTEAISSEWLQLVMIAERPAIGRFSKGAVHQTIYYPAWLSMHIALPPIAEQHRIVAKVDELMGVCDRLEASLAAGDHARSRLLDALLAEALEPAALELEAA